MKRAPPEEHSYPFTWTTPANQPYTVLPILTKENQMFDSLIWPLPMQWA